jgi:hypothetical protein
VVFVVDIVVRFLIGEVGEVVVQIVSFDFQGQTILGSILFLASSGYKSASIGSLLFCSIPAAFGLSRHRMCLGVSFAVGF